MKHSTLIAFGTQDGGDSRVQKNEWNESHALEADENFVSDAELAILQATSGSNTGDQAAGDFNHDDLANITGTAGQYNHPTNAQIAGLHAESHTVASHSDTTATGTELETLTDGSDADALHAHAVNDAKVTNATHSGEVTGSGALTIADNVVDEANLKLDTGPTNDYVLTADSTKSGGMKWAASGSGSSTFVALTDTPANYTSKAGYMPVVNSGETALEFVTAVQAFDGGSFSDTYIDTVDFDGGAF